MPQSLVIDSSVTGDGAKMGGGIHSPREGGQGIEGGMASETQESEEEGPSSSGPDKVSYHRSNTTMHVCWHRQTSVSMNDHIKSVHVSQPHSSSLYYREVFFHLCNTFYVLAVS